MATSMIWVAALLTILGITIYFLWTYQEKIMYWLGINKFPVKAIKIQTFGNGYQVKEDRMQIETDRNEGKETMRFLHSQDVADPISREYVYNGGNGDKYCILKEPERREYEPLEPGEGDKLETGDRKGDSWLMHQVRKQEKFWEDDHMAWWQSDAAKWTAIGMTMLLILVGGAYYVSSVNEQVVKTLKTVKGFAPLVLTGGWFNRE